MADIFLSYARADKARVAPLVEALEAQGWTVWWDPEINPGQEFDDRITEEIDNATAVVVVWTPTSVASRWVRGEARLAADRGILVPVRFENARLPIDALALHTIDLDDWNEDAQSAAFKGLSRALVGLLAPVPKSENSDVSGKADESVSIAVLPFTNMSSDPEQEYFSDGLSEELINQLVKIKRLQVTGRTSSFMFKGKTDDLRLIGNRLGVNHVLEGSVRKAGNRLRITAQLVKCRDGFHLWSQTYDRQLEDVFAIQDDVAAAVAEALGTALGFGESAPPPTPTPTTHLDAYDKYLRAGALIRSPRSIEDLLDGTDLLREALALDPGFAPARAALALTYIMFLVLMPETRDRVIEDLSAVVTDALARVPNHWATHLANGLLSEQRQDWLAADAAYTRARALAPSSESIVGIVSGLFFGNTGRATDAIYATEPACNVDPLSLFASAMFQLELDIADRASAAQTEFERTWDLPSIREIPEHLALMRLWGRSDTKTIKAHASRFFEHQSLPMPVLKQIYEVFDRPAAGHELLRRAFDDPANQDRTRMMLIGLYAAHFADDALAVAAMRRAIVDMKGSSPLLIWHPVMRNARKTSEFKQLLRDMGLMSYWRRSGQWGDFARSLGDDDFEIIK